jgi:hypothetical protein
LGQEHESMITDKPTVPEVMPLVRKIYEKHAAGCCLHIVTDDDNTENHMVDFCIQRAQEQGHRDCEEAAVLLRRMSRTQRHRIYREH